MTKTELQSALAEATQTDKRNRRSRFQQRPSSNSRVAKAAKDAVLGVKK
jgi:hypothetical protein